MSHTVESRWAEAVPYRSLRPQPICAAFLDRVVWAVEGCGSGEGAVSDVRHPRPRRTKDLGVPPAYGFPSLASL